MPQGFDRRDAIPDRLAPTGQAKPTDRVPLAPIQSPRPASQKHAGAGAQQIANLLGAAGGVLDQYVAKKTEEAIIDGQMAYAEGVEENDILAKGNKHTTRGFMSMKLRASGNEWMQNEIADIADSGHQMSPEDYRAKLSEGFKELSSQTGNDQALREMMVGMASDMMPKLVSRQTQSHNEWNKENTIQSYTELLVSETGTSPEDLIELTDPNTSPLGADDHRAVVSNAIGIQLKSGVTTLYDALTPDATEVSDFIQRGFTEAEATGMSNAVDTMRRTKSAEFDKKRLGTEQTIVGGVAEHMNLSKTFDEIQAAKDNNDYTDQWANSTFASAEREFNKAKKEQHSADKLQYHVDNNEVALLTGDARGKALLSIEQDSVAEARLAIGDTDSPNSEQILATTASRIYHKRVALEGVVDTKRKGRINAVTPQRAFDNDGNPTDYTVDAVEEYLGAHVAGGPAYAAQYLENDSYMGTLMPLITEHMDATGQITDLDSAITLAAAQVSEERVGVAAPILGGDLEGLHKQAIKMIDENFYRPGTLLSRGLKKLGGGVSWVATIGDEKREYNPDDYKPSKDDFNSALQDPELKFVLHKAYNDSWQSYPTLNDKARKKIATSQSLAEVQRRMSIVGGNAVFNPAIGDTVHDLAGTNGDDTLLNMGVSALFETVGTDFYDSGVKLEDIDVKYHAESGNFIIRPKVGLATGFVNTVIPALQPKVPLDIPLVISAKDAGAFALAITDNDTESINAIRDEYRDATEWGRGTNTSTLLGGTGDEPKGIPGDNFQEGFDGESTNVTVKPTYYASESNQIQEDEGFKPYAYKDSLGKWTIGTGHLLPQDKNWSEGDTPYSKEELRKMYEKDLKSHAAIVEKVAPNVPKEAKQILTNMAFNLGETRLKGFKKMLKAVNSGDYSKAADEMENSTWYKQVKGRGVRLVKRMRSLGETTTN